MSARDSLNPSVASQQRNSKLARTANLTDNSDLESLFRAGSSSKSRKVQRSSKSPSHKSLSPSKSRSESKNELKSAKSAVARAISRRKSRTSAKTRNTNSPLASTAEMDDYSDQGFTTLSLKIFEKTSLRTLILKNNNLRSIPPEISELHNLEYLDLSKNPFRVKDAEDVTSLPIEMRLLVNLKYLSLRESNLRHIPLSVWLCISLETLDISRNKISLLVPDVGNLQELNSINLCQCNLTTLPGEIGFCNKLCEILLMANPIECLPDQLKDCKSLQRLQVSYRNFSSLLDPYMENLISKGQIKSEHIPLVVFELHKLTSIDLQHTKINTLPDNNLKSLETLYLDHNYISTLGVQCFSSMVNSLQTLTLSYNLLTQIPTEINNLVNLHTLDVSHNAITTVKNCTKLLALRNLDMSFNKIQLLNSNIKYLKNLRRLAVNNNELTEMSDELFSLNYIEFLDLSYNKLNSLSTKLCNLKAIKSAHLYQGPDKTGLWLLNNPLRVPPKDIWQTTNIAQIHAFLFTHLQCIRNEVSYAKLLFLGESGVGKSRLINSFSNKAESQQADFKTRFARKTLKRTPNKVEWLIIDVGCDNYYSKLLSPLISSIDPETEPTIFVIVYNHRDYTSEESHRHIGKWIEGILLHLRVSVTYAVQIKLIGIVDGDTGETEAENEAKINRVLNDCGQIIIAYQDKLVVEQARLEKLLQSQTETPENLERLYKASDRIKTMLKRKVYLNGDILLVDTALCKKRIKEVMGALEAITIELGCTVPLDLNIKLRQHIAKLNNSRMSISQEEFLDSLNRNPELRGTSPDLIIDYAKTIGEIFWLKYDNKFRNVILIRSNHIFNVIKTLMRHDLQSLLKYDDSSLFKALGLFESQDEFSMAVEKACKYGSFEHNLIYGLSFVAGQTDMATIKEELKFLEQLALLYTSSPEVTNTKGSFFNAVIPDMCICSFEEDQLNNEEKDTLFSESYEQYFVNLNKLERYKELLKMQNVLKKREKTFIVELEDHLKEEAQDSDINNQERLNQIQILNINHLEDKEFLEEFLRDKKHLTDRIDKEEEKIYTRAENILVTPVHGFPQHLFWRLSILMQQHCMERFDWSDTIIGRDNEFNCFKIKFTRDLIVFQLKSLNNNLMEEFSNKIIGLLEELFNYYAGLYQVITVEIVV